MQHITMQIANVRFIQFRAKFSIHILFNTSTNLTTPSIIMIRTLLTKDTSTIRHDYSLQQTLLLKI